MFGCVIHGENCFPFQRSPLYSFPFQPTSVSLESTRSQLLFDKPIKSSDCRYTHRLSILDRLVKRVWSHVRWIKVFRYLLSDGIAGLFGVEYLPRTL